MSQDFQAVAAYLIPVECPQADLVTKAVAQALWSAYHDGAIDTLDRQLARLQQRESGKRHTRKKTS